MPIRGTNDLLLQPDRVEFDPVQGATRWRVWESLSSANIDAQAAAMLALHLNYHVSSTGTKYRIEVQIPGGSTDPTQAIVGQDRWEMPANEIQKSIWEHPSLEGISDNIISVASTNVANGTTYDDANTALVAAGAAGADLTLLLAYYDMAIRGNTHFALGQYVLKHTTNVGQGYAANVADRNVERLYTTAQLIAEVTDATLWVFPLPGRLQYKIEHIESPPAKSGYLWSWRKLPSSEMTAAGGRVEISTEYWLEQWSILEYLLITD